MELSAPLFLRIYCAALPCVPCLIYVCCPPTWFAHLFGLIICRQYVCYVRANSDRIIPQCCNTKTNL